MRHWLYYLGCGLAVALCFLCAAGAWAEQSAPAAKDEWFCTGSDPEDPLNMYVLYWQKCAENQYRTFRQWPLEEQAAFQQVLKPLRQRQIDKYGGLPPFAVQILANEHLLPTEEMLPQTQAVETAWLCARQRLGSGADGAEACVSLYKTPLGLVFWHVEFRCDGETLLEVKVDAFTGGMLPVW